MPLPAKEPMYCAEQIKIPPALPDILKQFTKAAIRTQPGDLLSWSAAYFDALSAGKAPPVKNRFEATSEGKHITPGLLSVLHKQLQGDTTVPINELKAKWAQLSLPGDRLDEILTLGNFVADVNWLNFLSLACTSLESNLTDAVTLLCKILTKDAEGGPAGIEYDLFKKLYTYLAEVDGNITQEHIESVLAYLDNDAAKNANMIGPAHFTHAFCPKLSG